MDHITGFDVIIALALFFWLLGCTVRKMERDKAKGDRVIDDEMPPGPDWDAINGTGRWKDDENE